MDKPNTATDCPSSATDREPLRIVFAGTPEFAAASLDALLTTSHPVVAVYTQPDRPSGRGKKLTPSPVKQRALEAGLPVFQPESLKPAEAQKQLADLEPDLMVVAAYGLLLPEEVLTIPRLGCINVHASLLPRWRGAAPIERALLAGDNETGITIMQMDVGLDTGAMLLKRPCPIEPDDTGQVLHDRLMALGAQALHEALEQIVAGTAVAEPQDEARACYATKLTKAEGALDWGLPAEVLDRRIRGLNPRPVAYSDLNGERIRLWDCYLGEGGSERPPGELICAEKDGLKVATGQGVLVITRMQLPGKKQLPVADLLNARQDLFRAGNRFDSGAEL